MSGSAPLPSASLPSCISSLFRSTCICATTVLQTNRGTSSGSSSLSPSMLSTPGSASCSSPTRSTTCTLTQSETAMKVSEQTTSVAAGRRAQPSAGALRFVGSGRPGSGLENQCAALPVWQMAFAVLSLERLPSLFSCLHGLSGLQES